MKKFRTTFILNNGKGDDSVKIDVQAQSSDEAFHKAYKILKQRIGGGPEYLYSDAYTEEIPEGASNIGIKFKYYDGMLKKTFSNYIIIRAESEKKAVEFYNRTVKPHITEVTCFP